MFGLNKGMSLVSRGLRYKLRIAFSLMSIIPLLVCIYLFFIFSPYVARLPFSNIQIAICLFISMVIAIIGFLVAKQIVDPILEISSEARSIAKGEFDKTIQVYREDEIGDLGNALNQLTRRIRDNMDELYNYGERTKQINSEINKRVVVLSGLLQISNLITQGAKLKEIFDISTAKLAQLKDASWTILVTKEEESFKISAQFGILEKLSEFLLTGGCKKIFDLILLNKNGWIITDKQKDTDKEEVKQIFAARNMIFTPVFRHAKIIGFLGVGSSNSEAQYTNDDLELLGIFAKQVAIAIENEYLVERLQKLEIKDSLTGLYNKGFIVHRLDEEIKRAMIYQRPCAFVIFAIDRFNEYLNNFGQLAGEEILKRVAKILEENCTEIDRVARYGDYEFSLVLPERNKKQSVALAEDIRKKVEEIFSKENNEKKRVTICGAISENPIDGSSSKELVSKAEQLLSLAKSGKNTIKS